MMIGPYAPGLPALRPWDARAAKVAAMIQTLIATRSPDLQVEHVGSTAVHNCDGKGVVDLMVLYPPGNLEHARRVLLDLGFQRQVARLTFPDWRPLLQGNVTFDDRPFAINAHVLPATDDEVIEMRTWRDALRASTPLRGCYIAAKQAVLEAAPGDNTAYALAKGVFVQNAVWALRAGVSAEALSTWPLPPTAPQPAGPRSRTALLLVDAQANMFDPASPVDDADGLRERLAALLARAREAQAPVLFVQNDGAPGDPDEPGTPGWELESALLPLPGEPVLRKVTRDTFASTPLGAMLAAQSVRTLVIAGLQSEFCIAETVRGAAAAGVEAVLVADGHSTYPSAGASAAAIRERITAELASCAVVTPSREIAFSEGKTRSR